VSCRAEEQLSVNSKEWWRPENLHRAEQEFREESSDEASISSDFQSYKLLRTAQDLSLTGITLHNDVDPLAKVQAIAKLLGHHQPRSILDAGCGAGFTTKALAATYPDATVLGVDLAEDAIAYATAHHPEAKFQARPISPESGALGEFDTIFCFEFYPFTRNVDVDFQVEFIRYFVSQLTPNGRLVIYQTWKNKNSLAKIFDEVKAATPELNYGMMTTPSPRLSARLPLRLAIALSILASRIGGRDWAKPLIVVTKNNEGTKQTS
jgi:2-polyprenyl-3-methyl-5-hydroxy-6-metoxy-1,4-benzoquinol methylase